MRGFTILSYEKVCKSLLSIFKCGIWGVELCEIYCVIFFYVFICGCAYAKRRYYILVSNSK